MDRGDGPRCVREALGASDPARESAPASAPLTDEDIARLTLDGYDTAKHRVTTRRLPPDAGPLAGAYEVRASTGAAVIAWPDKPSVDRGDVHVIKRHGEDWAAGDVLAWVIVGAQPGLCMGEQGFMVLFKERLIVALTPWMGSCMTTSHDVRFVTVQERDVMLEEDGDTGEDPVTGGEYNVWVISGSAWKNVGRVSRTYEETREPYAVAGYARKMAASIQGTPAGIVATETWRFEPLQGSSTKLVVRTRVKTYTLHGDTLSVPSAPYPTP